MWGDSESSSPHPSLCLVGSVCPSLSASPLSQPPPEVNALGSSGRKREGTGLAGPGGHRCGPWASGVEFSLRGQPSPWRGVLSGAGPWAPVRSQRGAFSPQAALPTLPSVLLLQEEQRRGCTRGGGGGSRPARAPQRPHLQCLQLPGPGRPRRPGASHQRALRPAVRGGGQPLHRLLPIQLSLLHTDG